MPQDTFQAHGHTLLFLKTNNVFGAFNAGRVPAAPVL
jgi:hypothetical protein